MPNVYAELGSVWRSVMNDPDQAAHLLGKLITHVGPKRIAWGTDSLWYGSPQAEIVALRRFEFTERGKELYGLPYGLEGDVEDPTRKAPQPDRDDPQRRSSAATPPAPTGSTPTRAAHAIACDEVNELREDGYLRGEPGDERRVGAARLATRARARAHGARCMKIAEREAVVALRPRSGLLAAAASRWRSRCSRAAAERPPKPRQGASCAPAEVGRAASGAPYGHDFANTRHQHRERAISPGDVAELAPAWTFSTVDAGGEGDITGTPVVADGCVYVATNRGWVFALNADTGELVWKAQAALRRRRQLLRRRRRGKRVYVGGAPRTAGARPAARDEATRASGPTSSRFDQATRQRAPGRRRPLDTQPGSRRLRQPGHLRRRAADRRLRRRRPSSATRPTATRSRAR